MTDERRNTSVRRAARLLALMPAIVVTGVTSAAVADPPAQWADNPSVSAMHVLLVLVVAPLALFALIWLLVYLPSMTRGEKYKPGQAWRGEPEWFGGPRGGVEALEPGTAQPAVTAGAGDEVGQTRGGASGRW
ncbi:MAG: hypothetical protein ACJ72A_17865 [Nocardioidaceae bacterium]|nr:hypothetical protein [Nocardioidaceae bacterium]